MRMEKLGTKKEWVGKKETEASGNILMVVWSCGCVGIHPAVLEIDGAVLILRTCNTDTGARSPAYVCALWSMPFRTFETLDDAEHIAWVKRLQKRTRLANSHAELVNTLRAALRQTIEDDWVSTDDDDKGGDGEREE
jgi:hypothetical protein